MPRAKYRKGYADGTVVQPEVTHQEIVAVLKRNGATQHFFGEDERKAMVGFTARGRQIRFTLPYPEPGSPGRDAEVRRRWRCLLISIKAKFENVQIAESYSKEHSDTVFRAEFLAETVLREGKTVSEVVLPMVDQNYAKGAPLMLSGMEED